MKRLAATRFPTSRATKSHGWVAGAGPAFMSARAFSRPMDLARFFHQFKADPRWRYAIMAINLGGIAYGFFYYLPQFLGTGHPLVQEYFPGVASGSAIEAAPWYLWILIPDSPLAVLWAQLALLLYSLGRRNDYVDALAVVANIQVGLWTAYVLTFYWETFGIYKLNLNFWLLWLHLGMAAQALIFLHDLRGAGRRVVGAILAWVLFNDLMDYAYPGYGTGGCIGTRPYTVPCTDAIGLTFVVTVALTLVATGILAWWALRPRPTTRADLAARPR